MTTVFIGGSRAVSRLNPLIRAKLDELMSRHCAIFIGDANGADRAVQQHLAAKGYRNVVVFCMDECRNNLGGWPTRVIRTAGARKDFAYYSTKDRAMAAAAKCALMLWDGRSRGTLTNIRNMASAGKRTLVYLEPRKEFHTLVNEEDLRVLLARCDQGAAGPPRGRLATATESSVEQLFLDPAGR